jgi:hypothetical protein
MRSSDLAIHKDWMQGVQCSLHPQVCMFTSSHPRQS